MTGSSFLTFGMLVAFIVLIIAVLYATKYSSRDFTDYAVGGRSFSSWFLAMSYTNSWWPGATYTAFFGLSAGAGVLGLYALAYSLLGVTAMYLMAEHAWLWGKRFDLRTQCDMLGLRFDSPAVRLVSSLIGVICQFPWLVLGIQAMAVLIQFASFGRLSTVNNLIAGVLLIGLRQIWTVQMGMRGLVITDMIQGITAYGGSALLCLYLLAFSHEASYANLATLPSQLLSLPGHGGRYGEWYVFSLIMTGVIGSLCWPTSYQRIYTANGVLALKKGTVQTMLIAGGFYALLTLVALAASGVPVVHAKPQDGWFTLLYQVGGQWLLGLALVIMLAASMGWVDGCVQVCGAQIANDIVHVISPRSDRQLTIIAKASMAVFTLGAAVVAYFTYDFPRLQLLAQMAYQGIVQLSVPIFLGMFWKGGNRIGALTSMSLGFVVAAGLTWVYPDDIPALGSVTAGVLALGFNLAAYFGCHFYFGQSANERQRVAALFAAGRARSEDDASARRHRGVDPRRRPSTG